MTRPRTAFTFEVLNHFHHLTLQGKTTAWDFYNALVHETDNSGLSSPSVGCLALFSGVRLLTMTFQRRYNEFLQVVRRWRHLKMLKRGGRGHDPAGVAATRPGSLAVECPACPHPDRNLPDWWRTAPTTIAYVLFICFIFIIHGVPLDGSIRCILQWMLISA